jgi:hypothetical protein
LAKILSGRAETFNLSTFALIFIDKTSSGEYNREKLELELELD